MIASLRGQLIHKDALGAVIECGGVGYGVAMPAAALARLGPEGGSVMVLVHTHVTQDAVRLYGFLDAGERQTFLLLTATPGVGPRLALAILSALTPHELAQAVQHGDQATLTRVAGVGRKKAERLLVELKGRLGAAPLDAAQAAGLAALPVRDDVASALLNLGFAEPLAQEAAQWAVQRAPAESDVGALVRLALRAATRRRAQEA